MKKILILDFSSLLPSNPYYSQLEEEISMRPAFQGKKMRFIKLRREVEQFDLPVGSSCFLWLNGVCLVFKVDDYSFVTNEDFSMCTTSVSLKFSNFSGFNARGIFDYFEKEWKI